MEYWQALAEQGNTSIEVTRQIVEGADTVFAAYERGGIVFLLLLTVIAIFVMFMKGWIVPGYLYTLRDEDAKAWRAVAESQKEGMKEIASELREQRLAAGRSSGRRA
jgi:hypothetical protein